MNLFMRKRGEPEIPNLIYAPQTDISAYELGEVLKVFVVSGIGKERVYAVWKSLPECAKRHFRPAERFYK